MTSADPQEFPVFVGVFAKLGSVNQRLTRQGVARFAPGKIHLSVDRQAVMSASPFGLVGSLVSFALDNTKAEAGEVEIDLSRVRVVRCWSTSMFCLEGPDKQVLVLQPKAGFGRKALLARFTRTIAAASGRQVITEDIMHIKLMLAICGIAAAGALLAALAYRLVH